MMILFIVYNLLFIVIDSLLDSESKEE